jgi:predicted pyridoxine 5'-phosphate oxidase superfamily flavin-nucleotide-binding protein
MLTADMKRVVREQRLGYVATVNADGTPNLSPKGTFTVLDDATLAFAELRSPGTLRNVNANPAIEVNFIDPFVRKGYRFAGTATVIRRGAPGFNSLLSAFGDQGDLGSRMRAVVTIAVARALPITSPAYDRGATEAELRHLWTAKFRRLQPNERFEE